MSDVFLGRLVKAFGIRGEVKFHPADDFWAEVLESENLVLRRETERGPDERPIAFSEYRPHGNSYVVRIDGVNDRNEAEEMVGGEIFVAENNIDVELPERELPFQIIGTTVKSEDGRVLGRVTSVIFSPAHDVYEVTGTERTFLLPAVEEFIVSNGERHRELIIRVVPGLMDD